MLKPYTPPILLALVLNLAVSTLVFAQDYRPFHPSHVHYFAGAPNMSLRVDSVGAVGTDSVFWMNEIAISPSANCQQPWQPYYHFLPHQEGHFGDRFLMLADGQIDILDRAGDTIFLETQTPIGQSWSFQSSNPTLTATISAKSVTQVLGSADSLLTIDVSDGQQFQLSKNHGLVSGIVLSHYFRTEPPLPLSLADIKAHLHTADLLDWQAGDFFGIAIQGIGTLYPQTAYWYTITSRWESPTRDTVRFIRYVQRSTFYPPSGPGSTATPYNDTIEYDHNSLWYLNQATWEVGFDQSKYMWMQPWEYHFSGRIGLNSNRQFLPGVLDSCGYYPLVPTPNNMPYPEVFTLGLGTSYREFSTGSTMTTETRGKAEIQCYRLAGQDSLFPCPAFFDLVPVTEAIGSAHVWVSGNGRNLRWEGMETGTHDWQVLDIQGRTCASGKTWMSPSGGLELPALGSAGVYILSVAGPGGAWRTKFVKLD